MKAFFIILFLLAKGTLSSWCQPADTISVLLPESISEAVYLQKGKEAFNLFKVQLTEEGGDYIFGAHNQKTVFIGKAQNTPAGGQVTCIGTPPLALAKLYKNIYDYITGNREKDLKNTIPAIDLEVVLLMEGRYRELEYSFYNPVRVKKSRITDETPFSVSFAGLPVNADKLVIAKSNSSPDEWVRTYLYTLYAGRLKESDSKTNSGLVDFPPLLPGEYEARVLSELTSTGNTKKHRVIQHFSFKVEKHVADSKFGYIKLIPYNSYCEKNNPVNLSFSIYVNGKKLTESNPDKQNDLNEINSYTYTLTEGLYDVSVYYGLLNVYKKKIELKEGNTEIVSTGETNGRLRINFVDNNNKPATVKNCSVVIRSGNKEVFNNEYSTISTEANELPAGKYIVEIAWYGKPVIKEVEIKHCKETKIDIVYDVNTSPQKAVSNSGLLKIETINCTGKKIPVRVIYKEHKEKITHNIDPENNSVTDFTATVEAGDYDFYFYANDYFGRLFTYIPIKNIQIKAGETKTVKFNENTMGRLSIKFEGDKKKLEKTEYNIVLNPHGKQVFYDEYGSVSYNYSYTNRALPPYDSLRGILYPGKYTLTVDTGTGEPFVKEITIEPCKEVKISIGKNAASKNEEDCPNNYLSAFAVKATFFGEAIGLANSDKDSIFRDEIYSYLLIMRQEPVSYFDCKPNDPARKLDELIESFNNLSYNQIKKILSKKVFGINESVLKPRLNCNFFNLQLINIFDGASCIGQVKGIARYYLLQQQPVPPNVKTHMINLLSSANNALIKYGGKCLDKLTGEVLTMKQITDDLNALLDMLNKLDYSVNAKACCCTCGN